MTKEQHLKLTEKLDEIFVITNEEEFGEHEKKVIQDNLMALHTTMFFWVED